MILTSLASGSKHGHALLLDIESFAGVRLGPGTLYGAISRLEQRGLIEALGADDRRRPYRITAAGSAFLADALAELGRIVNEGIARLVRGGPRERRCRRLTSWAGRHRDMSRSRRLILLTYPPAWRERYGRELMSVIEAESGSDQIPWRVRLDVISAGLSVRLRSSGLVADDVPPESRVRAGLLLVLCAWAAIVVAGVGLQETSEHWQSVTPASERAVPAAAFGGVLAAAAIGSAAVLLGILLTAGPLIAFLRSGGWPRVRRPVLRAVCRTLVTGAMLAAVVVWAHQLPAGERNGSNVLFEVAYLVLAGCVISSIGAWTLAAVAVARRLDLTPATLHREAWLAVTVSLAMVAITGATTIWWIDGRGRSPRIPRRRRARSRCSLSC